MAPGVSVRPAAAGRDRLLWSSAPAGIPSQTSCHQSPKSTPVGRAAGSVAVWPMSLPSRTTPTDANFSTSIPRINFFGSCLESERFQAVESGRLRLLTCISLRRAANAIGAVRRWGLVKSLTVRNANHSILSGSEDNAECRARKLVARPTFGRAANVEDAVGHQSPVDDDRFRQPRGAHRSRAQWLEMPLTAQCRSQPSGYGSNGPRCTRLRCHPI